MTLSTKTGHQFTDLVNGRILWCTSLTEGQGALRDISTVGWELLEICLIDTLFGQYLCSK